MDLNPSSTSLYFLSVLWLGNTTLFCGYLFPVIVGTVLYVTLALSFHTMIHLIPYVGGGFALFTGLLWVRDIVPLIWFVFRAVSQFENIKETQIFLKFIALYLILSAACSTYLYKKFPTVEYGKWEGTQYWHVG